MKYLYLFFILIFFLPACSNHAEKERVDKNSYYDRAFEYREKGMVDSSFLYFIKAKDLFIHNNDSLGAGKCLVNMAILLDSKGDYLGSQEVSLSALSYFDQSDKNQFVYLRSNLNNLGIVTQKLGDVNNALDFYQSAIKFSTDTLDTRIYLNNIGTTYQQAGKYKAAVDVYKKIINEAIRDKKEYARALTNMSYNMWLDNRSYNPLPNLWKALNIRKEQQDVRGLNSSYIKLSDYYYSIAHDSALVYSKLSYKLALEVNSPEDQLVALQKIIDLSQEAEAKRNFKIYRHVNDSLQKAHSTAKNQFALIRYQTEKHKSDFLRAQADNEQKKNNILIQNFILIILTFILMGAYFWYRKRRTLMQQEKELEVKNTELKYVKKIHDKVANKVYHVMSEVENDVDMDREILLDKLEMLYNVSRDISYDTPDLTTESEYSKELSSMIQSYSSSTTNVFVIGNEASSWQGIDTFSQSELYVIMQELMTNMRKHSKALDVIVRFQRTDTCLNVTYSDDGIGMKSSGKKNGLTNTETRIKNIGATITFEDIPEEGLTIHVSIPTN